MFHAADSAAAIAMLLDFRNINLLWASVLVETLFRLGLKTAVISPGSRSTPLTVAFAGHPEVTAIPVLDERSAGFFALGVAKRTGTPVVLVCTSGTAGANYFPAVIEAKESQVPLLVLTADRPPELRDCASGQTIDQQKLFGHFPNAYAELALPEAEIGMLRYLRQTLSHLWYRSLVPSPGPVHVNCPFRDPLAPIEDGSAGPLKGQVGTSFFEALPELSRANPVDATVGIGRSLLPQPVPSAVNGLIVVGPIAPADPQGFCGQIAALSQRLGWPVLAEGLSPLRSYASAVPNLITTYDQILRPPQWADKLAASQVVQVGSLPTSKVLRQWLTSSNPRRWIVGGGDRNLDPLHGQTVPVSALEALIESLAPRPRSEDSINHPSDYLDTWLRLERQARQVLDDRLSNEAARLEAKIPWQLAHSLPLHTPIFVANSMPVRDVEWFWPPSDRAYAIYSSRGANGIDGILSTALGIAHGNRPAVLLTGDLALLHDTNGFLSAPRLAGHLTVVLVNNRGGGIFERLPIANFEPPFEEFFAMPQRVNLAKLCGAYGVSHQLIQSWPQLHQALVRLPTTGIRVLEVCCDRRASHQHRQALLTLAGDDDHAQRL